MAYILTSNLKGYIIWYTITNKIGLKKSFRCINAKRSIIVVLHFNHSWNLILLHAYFPMIFLLDD